MPGANSRVFARWAMLIAVLGIGARIFAIDRLPGINGDEAWYGANLHALAAGQPAFWTTPSGNPLNPLHSIPLYLFSLVFAPSIGLLRAPELLWSILAIALCYPLLRPSIGARSALIATALLAASPVAIAYGRLGWDPSGTPFVTLLALAFALRDKPVAAASAGILAVIVHPTNVFFLPILAAAWVPHARHRYAAPSVRTRKIALAATATGCLLFAVAAALVLRGAANQPATSLPPVAMAISRATSPSIWLEFLHGVNQMFAGVTTATFVAGAPGSQVRLAGEIIGLIALAAALNIRSRRDAGLHHAWLIAGIAAGAALFMVAAGPGGLQPGSERYALFLLSPLIVACSIGAGALPVTWSGVYVIGVTTAMLAFTATGYFAPLLQRGGDAHPTFRTGLSEPKRLAYEYVRAQSSQPASIICEDWWLYWPIKYLAGDDEQISVSLSSDAPLPPSVAGRLPRAAVVEISTPVYEVVFDGTVRWKVLSDAAPAFTARDAIGRPILHVFKIK
jgi:hypothetical protein